MNPIRIIILGIVLHFFFCLNTNVIAQNLAKRYALVEHFTNLPCPICATRNPNLYNRIAPYGGSVHHIAFYPGIPYSACAFYQSNIVENQTRKSFYGVSGSPSVYFRGIWTNDDAGFISTNNLNTALVEFTALEISVEQVSGQKRIRVKNRSSQAISGSNLRLFAVLAEKTVSLNAPNGETLHRDVFRKFLTNSSGNILPVIGPNETFELSLPFTIAQGWNAQNIFALAWVQDINTKVVENSGSELDITSITESILDNKNLKVFPNPNVGSLLQINWSAYSDPQQLDITDISGKIYYSEFINTIDSSMKLDIQSYHSGQYFIRLLTGKGLVVKSFVKE